MRRKTEAAVSKQATDPQPLLRTLAGRRGVILAVSGGPDSTALMQLAADWRERPPVLVVTVDHGLRPESAEEALAVARNAERLGLPWRIMTAPARVAGGNLQDWARRVRYQCLVEAAREAGFDTIATAHHQDDQAETFLLRLARGSGVYGLAAMAEAGTMDGILLARPFLDVPRETLTAIAAHSGLHIVADPSNSNPRFDRVRMRTLMPALAGHGVSAARLAETARRLRRAATALDHYVAALLRDRFSADPFGIVRGDTKAIGDAPEEVALRALALILRAVGGADYTPGLESVEALRSAILALGADETLKRTLHGVVLEAGRGRLTARREWGRAGLPGLVAPGGSILVWDRRFRIGVPSLAGALEIGPLGRSGVAFMAPNAGRETLQTLPGLFQNGTLVAVPEGIRRADDGAMSGPLPAECLVGERLAIGAKGATPPC